ncbi:hypothetical protein N0824_01543 [Microcystis sp. 0824]|nr:hypothetical protein N0824_01543 [Microcystis sp. 0824]
MIDHISTVDLFCGAGWLTHGFEKAGLKDIPLYPNQLFSVFR